ncbi:MAG: hypothetical protein ACK56F_03795, partial [bacterium]
MSCAAPQVAGPGPSPRTALTSRPGWTLGSGPKAFASQGSGKNASPSAAGSPVRRWCKGGACSWGRPPASIRSRARASRRPSKGACGSAPFSRRARGIRGGSRVGGPRSGARGWAGTSASAADSSPSPTVR